MILEVNGISFENMSNDEAVLALRESVKRPGLVKSANSNGQYMTDLL